MNKFLLLLVFLIPQLVSAKTFQIAGQEIVQGQKQINIVRRLERHLTPAQISQHKLLGVRIVAKAQDSSSFVEMFVNGWSQGIRAISRRGGSLYIESPQRPGQYMLDFNGFIEIQKIEVDLKSLRPELSSPVKVDQFHAGRYSPVSRYISLDMNRALGEIIIEVKSNDVEIENLWLTNNNAQRVRLRKGLVLKKGSRHVIPGAQNQFNFFRSIEIEAENEEFWGSKGEVSVSVRYWQ